MPAKPGSALGPFDLFSGRGPPHRDLAEVMECQKEILHSSWTRVGTDTFKQPLDLCRSVRRMNEELHKVLSDSPNVELLDTMSGDSTMSIVYLFYRRRAYESHFKGYEFSRASMEEHWQEGVDNATRTLRYPEWLQEPANKIGARTFDLNRDARN